MERVRADAARMGLSLPEEEPDALELWEMHIPTWRAWCAVSGQMRALALNTMESARILWLGLDYDAAKAGLGLAGIEVDPEVWDEVRTIEGAAIEELNRRGR
jgi:hypothetical protein